MNAPSDAVLAAAGDTDALDRLPQGEPPDGVALIAIPAQYLRQLVRAASFPDANVQIEMRGPDANGYFLPLFNVSLRKESQAADTLTAVAVLAVILLALVGLLAIVGLVVRL